MIDNLGLDTPSGHIVVGLLMVVGAIACSAWEINHGSTESLMVLGAMALRGSLQASNDGK